jgi:hypothetical protein
MRRCSSNSGRASRASRLTPRRSCDTMSHGASELADRRPAYYRMRSFRPRARRPGPTLDVRRREAGCEARGKAKGPLIHPGVTGKGQTGRVNRVNLRRCLVIVNLARWKYRRGAGAGRSKAAGAGRGFFVGRGAPSPSGYRRHPPRSQLARAKRGNPDGVRAHRCARSADRKGGPILQRGSDDLGSQCRQPKGTRKPRSHDRLSAGLLG